MEKPDVKFLVTQFLYDGEEEISALDGRGGTEKVAGGWGGEG
jgi:hypothetical protein